MDNKFREVSNINKTAAEESQRIANGSAAQKIASNAFRAIDGIVQTNQRKPLTIEQFDQKMRSFLKRDKEAGYMKDECEHAVASFWCDYILSDEQRKAIVDDYNSGLSIVDIDLRLTDYITMKRGR